MGPRVSALRNEDCPATGGGGTYAAERRIGYKALRRAGLTPYVARLLLNYADQYIAGLGVSATTVTRMPGDC